MKLPRRRILQTCLLAPPILAGLCPAAWARQVGLGGILGRKALLVIDGAAPRSLGEGDAYQGVRVLRVDKGEVQLDIDGQHRVLRLGDAPVGSAGGPSSAGPARIVLLANSRGHFTQSVRINDQLTEAVVDTGASTVAIGKREADRLGLDYAQAPATAVHTANGVAQAWPIRLRSMRMGEAQLRDVEAVVLPQDMPFVLLGNSFLAAFSMQRQDDQMVLTQRRTSLP